MLNFSGTFSQFVFSPFLRFESSKLDAGKFTSFDEYITRVDKDQKEIFFAIVPSRSLLEASPYYEPFKAKGIEVLELIVRVIF